MSLKAINVMYEQQLAHLPKTFKRKTLDCIIKTLTEKLNPVKIAGIIHDKDVNEANEPVKPHVHVVMQFKNQRSLQKLAKLLEEPQVSALQQWRGNVNNAYSYLIHQTVDAKDKHPYSLEEVIANFDFEALMKKIILDVKMSIRTKDEPIIRDCLDQIKAGTLTLKEAEDQLTGSQYAKAKTRLESVHQKRMALEADAWRKKMIERNRSIDVLWIYGEAGTGKTRLAKDYADTLGKACFLTGSSRDPFQHYQGEETIILDELRATTFLYSDLLKLLDPFNLTTNAPSRYYDKPLTADTIIITTPYSPKKFYQQLFQLNKAFDSNVDSYYQLARRLALVLRLDKKMIQVAFFDEICQEFILDKSTMQENPYQQDTRNSIQHQNERSEKLYKDLLTTQSFDEDENNFFKGEQLALFDSPSQLILRKKR